MKTLLSFLGFLFYPNPGNAQYSSTSMVVLLVLSLGLVVLSFVVRSWRAAITNPITKKLSRSWSSVCFWFGVSGAVLVVSRVEQIQFFAMRFLWVLWFVGVLLFVYFQVKNFRARHYQVLPHAHQEDPRDRYLPGRKH